MRPSSSLSAGGKLLRVSKVLIEAQEALLTEPAVAVDAGEASSSGSARSLQGRHAGH